MELLHLFVNMAVLFISATRFTVIGLEVIQSEGILQQELTNHNDDKFSFQYPVARRDLSIVDDYFGTKIIDPYRWLEDPDSNETRKFVQSQNNLTIPFLQKAHGRDLIRNRLESMLNYNSFGIPKYRKSSNRYFFTIKTGLDNQGVLYVQDGPQGEAKILLDPNSLSSDGTTAISTYVPSHNGEFLAYGLSSKGSDWVTIHFKNVSSGENFSEILFHSKWPGIQWTSDDVGIFYSGYPKPNGTADGSETTSNENMKLYFHRIGTPQTEDVIIVEFPEAPKRTLGCDLSDDERYLIITTFDGLLTSMIFYINYEPLKASNYRLEKPKLNSLLVKDDAMYSFVGSNGDVFYFLTNKGAPNNRIVGLFLGNKPDDKYWSILLPENPKDVLDWVAPVNTNQLVVCYIRDVKSVLEIRRFNDGSLIKEVDFGVGTVSSYSVERDDDHFFFSTSSFLYPGKVFKVSLFQGPSQDISPEIYHESVIEDLDANEFQTSQIFYQSKDGTRIPMFIVHKKDLKIDSSNAPTLLYGYGGFDVSLQPLFNPMHLAFVQLFNGILAIANIRGGGEYGSKWHDAGRLLNKQNTFDDFEAAAEYLIDKKYTSNKKLAIQGGSNGGLTVGACINQRPDLFGAAIPQVGVLDMLRYHKFTVGSRWATDYGTSDNKMDFDNRIKFSPLHNVRVSKDNRIQYPATLVMTGDHDDRVVPLHSYKFISELQFRAGMSTQQTNPLFILIETNAGHGGGKPTNKMIDEMVDVLSFLLQTLELEVQI